MFKARKWGWKQFAANLLLAPVIGGWAGVAHAQFNGGPAIPGSSPSTSSTKSGKPAGSDYHGMLKDGRKALANGQFDRAQDLARAAEANNPTGKWGLFEDTPNSLLKDVQAAVVKAQKTQAEQMAAEAKKLLAQPPKNPTERAANLDRALQLAQRADQLHGPYSAWEFGDRPDKLVKEIQAARGKTSNAMPGSAVAAKGPNTPATPGIQQAGGTNKPGTNGIVAAGGPKMPDSRVTPASGVATGSPDTKKATANQLMADGRKLADQGMFAAARAKFNEADRVGATFARGERSPGFELQELNTRGARAIDGLVTEAKNQTAKKDYVKADSALNGAGDIAQTLGLFPGKVKDAKGELWAASGGKFGTAAAGIVATGPDKIVPYTPPTAPVMPMGPVAIAPMMPALPAIPAAPVSPTAPVASGVPTNPVAQAGGLPPGSASIGAPSAAPEALTGRKLLLQAENEYKTGDLELAAKLAQQAYNLGGVKDEATALLNSIDAERLTQKTLSAVRSFEAAQKAHQDKDYNRALGVLVLIDPNLLPPSSKTRHAELVNECRASLEKPAATVATAGGQEVQPPPMSLGLPGSDTPPTTLPGVNPPAGTAKASNDPKPGGADNYTNQVDSLKRVQVQKLRAEGLKIQSDALAAFGRGETDLAMQMLVDYGNRVRNSGLEPASMAMLMRPIDSRLDMFRVMKGQADAQTRVAKESRDAKAIITDRGLADEQRRAEVKICFTKYHELVKVGKYAEAEKVAMQAKQLDPDNPAISALQTMAKTNKRLKEQEKLKADKENMIYGALTDAEREGPLVTSEDPLAVRLDSYRRSHGRGSLDAAYQKTRTPAEYEIELKLDKPIPIEINQTPLDQAIDHLRTVTSLPISVDTAAIEAEGINLSKPITEKLSPVATRHILTIVLEKAGLSYVVENDVVKVTTTKKAKGRLFTKVFSVADLVTPVPNFALPDYANFDKMLKKNAFNSGNVQLGGSTPGGANALGGGMATGNVMPGSLGQTPGIGSGGPNFSGAGQIQSSGGNGANPLAGSASLAGERNTKHEQLIKLITGMVRPYSWDGMGGPGRIEYFDIGSALVVNQVADVIQEVADLLEALRRLQDLAIAVEIRIVSLSETWYERLGVDFSMNIKTHTSGFEPALTQVDPNTGSAGVFRPSPYLNDNNFKGTTIGLSPAGTPTGDLDVPIRPNTFGMAVPPFGGYPNTPGNNGGLAFGLAFLNDIQVFMFMEAAQGDRRVNVMQAPKLTLFNGQTATLAVTSTSFFVTNVSVISVNGQLVFSPTNTPLAGPDTNFDIGIQAVVSADRRFVRLNLPVNLAAQTGATVPLFPVTTFITPVFEGGSQGIPIPFTQFLQQPSFTSLNIQTTVVCPDGGTVLLGGLKTLQEGRNEFGPPVLSKIPYLNRLFKNVGIGRETRHIMIMVTPRIIINSEEEIFQTEGRPQLGGGN